MVTKKILKTHLKVREQKKCHTGFLSKRFCPAFKIPREERNAEAAESFLFLPGHWKDLQSLRERVSG